MIILKSIELSSNQDKNGRRPFTAVLYELQPPECVVNKIGTNSHWNENGITFIEEYAVKNLSSIKDMSITVEFLDNEKTEILGHGDTGFNDDGLPVFENATVIGHFTKGYIGDYDNGRRAVYGKGFLDEMRYPNFVAKLEKDIQNGIYPKGSIEIFKPPDSDSIEYLNGKKEIGRIPIRYFHSGYSLLSVKPADPIAEIIELNESEKKIMNENEIKIITDSVKSAILETNTKNSEYESKISELNSTLDSKNTEISTLQKALDDLKKEQSTYWAEREILEKEIAKLKTEKRLTELNSAISGFSDSEKDYAKAEIEAYKAENSTLEVNAVVDKIYAGIGRNKTNQHDILSEVSGSDPRDDEYISLF